MKMGNKKYI